MAITSNITESGIDFSPDSVKLVKSAGDLAGALSSTVLYVIDGQIDMGAQQITVPQGGLHIDGYGVGISKLYSTENNYTMFIDDGVFSGDFFVRNIVITTSGALSKPLGLDNDGNFGAVEFRGVNFDDCTSMGEVANYRQGFELDTGRFGGSPNLILSGAWVGGYFIDASIVRGLDSGFAGSLYEEGTAFTMQSRFRSNQNIDLPANASFFDFDVANFPNASTVQIQDAIITRDGVANPNDANITPNISASDVPCAWHDNTGMPNTHQGGTLTITTEVETTITTINTFVDLLGTFAPLDLQHFDDPSNGQLRHIAKDPRDFTVKVIVEVTGGNGNTIEIKIVKWDDSASGFVDVAVQHRELLGSAKLGEFIMDIDTNLDENDYIKLQVANTSGTANVTANDGSMLKIIAR